MVSTFPIVMSAETNYNLEKMHLKKDVWVLYLITLPFNLIELISWGLEKSQKLGYWRSKNFLLNKFIFGIKLKKKKEKLPFNL